MIVRRFCDADNDGDDGGVDGNGDADVDDDDGCLIGWEDRGRHFLAAARLPTTSARPSAEEDAAVAAAVEVVKWRGGPSVAATATAAIRPTAAGGASVPST